MKKNLAQFILYYLRFFARLQLRKKLFGQIIGITGSAGKSSTRNAIHAVLSSKFRIKTSFKANSESGIPLDILGLAMRDYSLADWLRVCLLAPWQLLTNWQHFDYYIVEMGIDSPDAPKNMDYLLSIIKPNSGVFLGASANHGFAFDHLISTTDPAERRLQITRAIASEKAKLILSLPESGQAYLNGDDSNVMELSQDTRASLRTFGSQSSHHLQLLEVNYQLDSAAAFSIFKFSLHANHGREKFTLQIKDCLLASHFAHSFAAAILIGLEAGLSLSEVKRALEQNFHLPAGRATTIAGRNHSLIIDSSYNASAMADMIELVSQLPSKGRKFALLGDLRELGELTESTHQNIAQLAAKNFSHIYLVGDSMQKFALPILRQKKDLKVQHFANAKVAGETIAKLLKKDDLILVKGSQNTIFLEEAVKEMMQEPSKARQLLCRQSQWWLQVKAS
jgi:UDP-N-acetylmuramoyl-tripeptide--D-alanyl-D-alanine ligase